MRHIGKPLTKAERAALIAFARSQVGVRFKHQGRQPGVRLDCAGLGACALVAIGRPVLDLAAYGREPHKDGLAEYLGANLGPPVDDAPRAGDFLLLRQSGDPRHVGLVGDYAHGGESLIHASGDYRKVVEHVLDPDWRARIVAVYRP